jgi:hypothetical protein
MSTLLQDPPPAGGQREPLVSGKPPVIERGDGRHRNPVNFLASLPAALSAHSFLPCKAAAPLKLPPVILTGNCCMRTKMQVRNISVLPRFPPV